MSVTSEAILSLQQVSLGYHATHPLIRNVSLTLPAGSFAAVLGPNGSGKSTLLKTILGLIPPLAGEIKLGNVQVTAPSWVTSHNAMHWIPSIL